MGNLTLNGSTSGQVTLTPPAVAGTNTITLPAATGTVLTTAGGQTISGTVTLSTLTSPAATDLTIQSAGTTAMTINTSGQILVGYTTTPVSGPSVTVQGTASGFAALRYNTTASLQPYLNHYRSGGSTVGTPSAVSNNDGLGRYSTYGYNGTSAAYVPSTEIRSEVDGVPSSSDMPGRLVFATTSAGATSVTERMRIDSSGNVGIGTTSPSYKLDVKDGAIRVYNSASTDADLRFANSASTAGKITYTSQDMTFTTAGSERMRIDSSGNLLVGTTSSNGRLSVDSAGATSATYAVYVRNSTPSDLLYIRSDGFFSTGGAASSPYNATTATAANVVVASNGQLQRSTSSLKYKTDVKDATHGLAEVLQLRPVTYKGKNDGDTVFGGLIAEEVDAIGLTEFVQYAEDGSPDALAYGNMVSLLVKAIQEQQSIISDLQSRIAALEAK